MTEDSAMRRRACTDGRIEENRETGGAAPRLAPRPEERFAQISIRVRFQNFRPLAERARSSRLFRPWISVPPDLFHGMVKLNAVTVRVEDLGRIVDAGMEFGRNHFGDLNVTIAEKFHGIAKLAVVSDLQAERGAFGVGAKTEHIPERQGQERQRVMLRVATKEKATVAFEDDLLGQGKAQCVTVERFSSRGILNKKIDGTEADDLERARQRNTVNIKVAGNFSTER